MNPSDPSDNHESPQPFEKMRDRVKRLLGEKAVNPITPEDIPHAQIKHGMTRPLEGQPSRDFTIYEIRNNTITEDEYLPKREGQYTVIEYSILGEGRFSDTLLVFTKEETDEGDAIVAYALRQRAYIPKEERRIRGMSYGPISTNTILSNMKDEKLVPVAITVFDLPHENEEIWNSNRHSTRGAVISRENRVAKLLKATRDGITLCKLDSELSDEGIENIAKLFD